MIWVDGLNVGDPVHAPEESLNYEKRPASFVNMTTRYPSMPFNYRDVKLLKYGRTAMQLHTISPKTAANDRSADLKDILEFLYNEKAGVPRLKTLIEFEQSPDNFVNDINYTGRSHGGYHNALLEASGILQTLDVKIKYANFDQVNFGLSFEIVS